MPRQPGSLRRDPLSAGFDEWARGFLDVLKADPWEWHARWVDTPRQDALLGTDSGGLSRHERAAQRSLYWCLGHAASSGLKTRPAWSLQVTWGDPRHFDPGRLVRRRRRLLTARLTPKGAGQRAVLIRGRGSYIANPTSRGALDGESWQPKN